MASNKDELLKRLLVTFRLEADEHLQALSAGLGVLEKAPAATVAAEQVETMFREVHSLKGAARAVNRTAIESFCRVLENVFAALRAGRLKITASLLQLLHEAVDRLQGLLDAAADESPESRMALARLLQRLETVVTGADPVPAAAAETSLGNTDEAEPGTPAPAMVPVASAGTVRVATAKLDMAMRQVEELLSPRLAARQRVQELRDAAAVAAAWKKKRARIQPALHLPPATRSGVATCNESLNTSTMSSSSSPRPRTGCGAWAAPPRATSACSPAWPTACSGSSRRCNCCPSPRCST